ncbi:ABC-type Zn uptake system ZnuABC, Zn-binding component ZnuA [Clostridium cavendishii DSM 21758]|uniref:ABC-type Zn uptake system ZnuABC, Zn-binding component ZnuA n=1 Tax=Clostridium cavendishii DSM 21758 TaxID=1121302 RepID=A0A1M6UEF3_9CLOT|nr:zinc ABC transporter substrate-binding protein [Clostridium cavendishii]SHK67556.1 ABC-type Zn uptake system ZnuABC, Zn-binding component ZnuA [Clostridium cavendishii DSM 21758]
MKINIKKITFIMIIVNVIFFMLLNLNKKPVAIATLASDVAQREVYLNIMTTDRIIYNMAKDIAQDKHNVQYMFKDKKECNDFKFTEDTLENISNMDLFLYAGSGNEPWMNDFISKLKKGKVGIINTSRGIKILSYDTPKVVNNFEIKENPNFVLSPKEYKIMLYNLKSAIQDKDPKNREFYEKNYESAKNTLELNEEEVIKLKDDLKTVDLYTFSDDLDYLNNYLALNVTKIDTKIDDKGIKDINGKEQGKNGLLICYGEYDKALADKLNLKQLNLPAPYLFDNYQEYLKAIQKLFKENITKSTT